MRSPFLLDRPARVAFSGGRTSGLMLWEILQAFGGALPGDVVTTFANTGRENERTLQFVRDVEQQWGVPIRWVEYSRTDEATISEATAASKRPLIGCHGFREVTFETASRNGEPFEAIIDVKADYRAEAKGETPILPNPTDRWCSGELKHRTMERLMRSLGFDDYTVAVGLRADEPERVAKMRGQSTRSIDYVCPLARAGITEADVLRFWKAQPFDLTLPHDPKLGTYAGNCDLCFLKRTAKIQRLLVEQPEAFDWWAEMEEKTGARFRKDRPGYRAMADRRVSLFLCEDEDDLDVCLCTD